MSVWGWVRRGFVVALLLSVVAAVPVRGAGFGIFEQGTKATGMSNAFTAQADDPSAMFYNAGGLAFQHERDFLAGATLIFLGDSDFEGVAPFPGTSATGEQKDQLAIPFHFYWVEPISDKLTFGLGLNTPFGLVTQWEDPSFNPWTGRYISTRAELTAVDLNPNIAWQISKRIGVALGLIGRISTVDLQRRQGRPNLLDPSFGVIDVAEVELESDMDTGFGANIGVLHKATDWFTWGFSYRSKIEIDYGGDAVLTQTPIDRSWCADPGTEQLCDQWDQLVADGAPFGQKLPIETAIEFPDMASLGLAFQLTRQFLFEADLNWTGWSSFDTTAINFTQNPDLSSTIVSNWDDAMNYRFGLLWDVKGPSEWRFGFYLDDTPQPDSGVGPLLPDADRVGVSAGYGRPINKKTYIDLTLMNINFRKRTTTTNNDNFNGTYDTTVWLAGASIGF